MTVAALAKPRTSRLLRAGLGIYAIVLYVFAAGFFFREWWATDLWPFSYTSAMSHIFISSILAAAGTSILYCTLANELRAMVGVGIDAVIIATPVAVIALMTGRKSLHTLALLALTMAAAGLFAALWFHRYTFRHTLPTPIVVRFSFVAFILALWSAGGAMAAGSSRVLPWEVTPETTRIYGWFFLGASSYFLYGLLVPKWGNAAGQLLSFLAYDLVLIWPFIVFFRHVSSERLVNHIVYTTAVVFSAAVAIYYCFIDRRTRVLEPWSR